MSGEFRLSITLAEGLFKCLIQDEQCEAYGTIVVELAVLIEVVCSRLC